MRGRPMSVPSWLVDVCVKYASLTASRNNWLRWCILFVVVMVTQFISGISGVSGSVSSSDTLFLLIFTFFFF